MRLISESVDCEKQIPLPSVGGPSQSTGGPNRAQRGEEGEFTLVA